MSHFQHEKQCGTVTRSMGARVWWTCIYPFCAVNWMETFSFSFCICKMGTIAVPPSQGKNLSQFIKLMWVKQEVGWDIPAALGFSGALHVGNHRVDAWHPHASAWPLAGLVNVSQHVTHHSSLEYKRKKLGNWWSLYPDFSRRKGQKAVLLPAQLCVTMAPHLKPSSGQVRGRVHQLVVLCSFDFEGCRDLF